MRARRDYFRGRRVLVTGAASGIGRATARAAARAGAHLVLTDLDATALAALADEISSEGGAVAHTAALDITDYDAVRTMADAVHDAHGSVDVVMNVAGIAIWGAVEHLTHDDWRRTIEVNLMGPIHVIECFVPPMIAAGRGGHIVSISSAAGLFGLPWHAPYSATKFGVRGISEVLRFDLRRHGIGVSVVLPGAVNTSLVDRVHVAGMDRDDPRVQRLIGRFRRHAIPPERAAATILDGVERGRYLIFTSRDIQVTHWLQRKWELPYAIAMRVVNRRLLSGLDDAPTARPPTP